MLGIYMFVLLVTPAASVCEDKSCDRRPVDESVYHA